MGFLGLSLPFLVATILPSVDFLSGAETTRWIPLFDDAGLTGWDTWIARPHASVQVPGLPRDSEGNYTESIGLNRDPLGVFTLVNSPEGKMLHVSGQVFGAIITKQEFVNYHLRLQFKWGERQWPPRDQQPRDTGLLYRVQSNIGEPGRSFPRSLEFQIQEKDLGDLYVVALRASVQATLRDKGTPQYHPGAELQEFGAGLKLTGTHCAKSADFERAHGEWNTLELVCFEGQSWHIVNGHVVMRAEKPRTLVNGQWSSVLGGRIALQSEGAEVFYRGVEICPITGVPPALLQK